MPKPNRNDKAEFWTVSMAMGELNMCRASTIKLAAEAGALLRYGNSQRINWNRLNSYFKKTALRKSCKDMSERGTLRFPKKINQHPANGAERR